MTPLLASPPFTALPEALGRLEAAVSPLTGIVTRVVTTMHAPDETSLPNSACELASAERTLGAATVDYGSGAHVDGRRARAAALGEALERYSTSFVPSDRLEVTTTRAIGSAAVEPERFALFHRAQHEEPGFPFVPFDDTTPTHFVRGVALADEAEAYVPAQLVYLAPLSPVVPSIGYATSSGLACAPTLEEAILAALLELVERDAVMLAWNDRLSLPLLEWAADERLASLERMYFAPSGLRYSVLDGSVFLDVPICIGVLHGPSGSGASLAVGAGCAAQPCDAWLKALSESFGVYRWLGLMAATQPDRAPPAREDVRTFDDHMLFYASEERAALAAFLDGSRVRTPIAAIRPLEGRTPRAQIAALVARLARHDISAYAVDTTSPDVASIGLRVARVIAPELATLDVWHRARYLGGNRLYTAAFDAGLAAAPLDLSDLNPHPHPFP